MHFVEDTKLDYDDVLIRPHRGRVNTRADVTLTREFKMLHSGAVFTGIPIIAANMDTVGTFQMAEAMHDHRMITALHKHYSFKELCEFIERNDPGEEFRDVIPDQLLDFVFFSFGASESDEIRMHELFGRYPWLQKTICLDVANGYTKAFEDFVKRTREKYPESIIMAGNVVTGDMASILLDAGADIIKVGIGPGSVCTTRKVAGVGYPQLSAVIECANAAHQQNGLVCADGGCKVSGDVAKAFGAGADFVMLGGMLAGHDECGGEEVYDEENPIRDDFGEIVPNFVRFYGMSSDTAMKKHYGGVASHRASEGKTVLIPYRGRVSDTLQEILGGIRSACTYTGSMKLKELSKRTTFVKVNRQYNKVYGD